MNVHDGSLTGTVPGAPRARRRDANLGRILDAAARLVANDGLDALSMARLAEAADYTPGALYRYVDSKDALLALLVRRILDDLRGELAAAVAALPPSSPLERIAAMVRAHRELVAREPHRYGVLAIALATPRVLLPTPAHAAPVTAAVIATLQPLADALIAAASAGQLDAGDPVARTLALFVMLHGLAQLPKLTHHAPGAFDVDRIVRAATRALLIGWGGRPARVDAALGTAPAKATPPRKPTLATSASSRRRSTSTAAAPSRSRGAVATARPPRVPRPRAKT